MTIPPDSQHCRYGNIVLDEAAVGNESEIVVRMDKWLVIIDKRYRYIFYKRINN